MGPLARVSRPTTTRPAPTYVPKACAKARASAGVRNSPTTPRMPETPIFRRCALAKVPHTVHQRFKQSSRRYITLFANDAHRRLGLAHAHVEPSIGPVDTEAVGRVDMSIA